MSKEERKEKHMEPENVKELLSVVSTEVPTMIKSIMSSVFSEEAGKNMGKAAAAYYKELKAGGLPDEVAVKLTSDKSSETQAEAGSVTFIQKKEQKTSSFLFFSLRN